MSESKFLGVICPRCRNTQIIFGRASLKVKCEKCNLLLVKTGGGKTKIKAKIEKIYN